jgi:serine/threonine-protein kinase
MSMRIPPAGFELHGYSFVEPLPHETGELEVPLWLAEETGTLDPVLIALLGAARLAEGARQAIYDRCLSISKLEHPTLAGYLDSTSPENPDCFVVWSMPPGVPLRRRLQRQPADLAFALRLLASAARGLSALHAAGEVHGALCPALLGVGDRDHAFLLAAGCGSLVLDDPTLAVAARYRAPEQLAGPGAGLTSEVGPPADVWALGILLYELSEGVPPHSGASVEEVRRAALALQAPSLGVLPGAPLSLLDELVARSIDPDPAHRFADAGEMADRLDELRSALEPRTVARTPAAAASAQPLVVTTPLDPARRTAPPATPTLPRAAPAQRSPPDGVPLAFWIVPALLLVGLVALLLWWVGVL